MFMAARRRASKAKDGPVLPARAIFKAAARTGRRHASRIIVVAIGVTCVASGTEIAADHFAGELGPVSVVSGLAAAAIGMMGVVFLSGFLSQLVGQEGYGRPPAALRKVLRELPWRRLIVADLLVVVIVAIGTLALIVPGLIATNLLVVTGPVIEIEQRPVVPSLRRAAHLVRLHFWKVALIATLPVEVADQLTSRAPALHSVDSVLAVIAIRGVAEGLVEAALGLILAEVAYRLIQEDRDRVPGQPTSSPGPARPDQATRPAAAATEAASRVRRAAR
jgi:hypothetical protein